jgi:hypothetical protein
LIVIDPSADVFGGDEINRPQVRKFVSMLRGAESDPWVWTMAKLRSRRVRDLEWVDWFNNRQLLEPIGNIPPAEAEQRYYAAMLQQPPWRHNLNQMASGKPGAVQQEALRRSS